MPPEVDPLVPLPELVAALTGNGWRAGAPPGYTSFARTEDQLSCQGASCRHCCREGLRLHLFQRGSHWKTVSECPHCGHAREF